MAGRSRGTNVQLVGIEELQASLETMLRETEDLRPAWEAVYHQAVLDGQDRFFASEGDGRWGQLTDRYLFYKARHGGGTRILVGTPRRRSYPRVHGTLRDSLARKGHPLHIYDTNPRWMRTGTRDPVANIHFSKKGRRKRRPIDVKSSSMQVAFRQAVEEHLRRYGRIWEGRAT